LNEAEISQSRRAGTKQLDLFFSPTEITEERLRTYRSVVVVDVLRAATSITMALANGAREVMPVASISGATALAAQLDRDDILLCGEREGRLIDGFSLGNSPSDYSRERVRGKTLIFGSTNGTPAIVKATGAPTVLVCGFVNLPSVLEVLFEEGEPFPMAIVCAGKLNRFSIEDGVCSGQLIERICQRLGKDPQLNDAARVSRMLLKEYGGDILALLHSSDHGKYLISIGMEGDLAHCAAIGVLPVVPVLRDGKLVKWESG
jgi:2-phosphosulfolactate phosphatase